MVWASELMVGGAELGCRDLTDRELKTEETLQESWGGVPARRTCVGECAMRGGRRRADGTTSPVRTEVIRSSFRRSEVLALLWCMLG